MKWILCAGCGEHKLMSRNARCCSARCRNRVWRRARGAGCGRLQFCAWCGSPLLYLPQDRLPAVRRFCHGGCARKAWLVERAERSMTCAGALEVAIRSLRRSRYPRVLAAAVVLAELHRELIGRAQSSNGISRHVDSTSAPPMSVFRDRVSAAASASA